MVVQHCPRQRAEERADGRRDAQLLARGDDVPQAARQDAAGGNRLRQRLQPHIGQEQPFDRLALEQVEQRIRIAPLSFLRQHEGAARGERGEDFLERDVEAERRELERAGRAAEARVRAVPGQQRRQRQAAHGDALGLAAGAGGEQHVGEFPRSHGFVARHGRWRAGAFDPAQRLRQPRARLGVAESRLRLRQRQHRLEPCTRIARVERQAGRAGREDGQQRLDRGRAAGGVDGDDVAGSDAGGAQARDIRLQGGRQRGMVQARAGRHQGRRLRLARRLRQPWRQQGICREHRLARIDRHGRAPAACPGSTRGQSPLVGRRRAGRHAGPAAGRRRVARMTMAPRSLPATRRAGEPLPRRALHATGVTS